MYPQIPDLLNRIDYHNQTIFPPKKDVFRSLELTPFDKVKVVILGQDPYHAPQQAMGLAFSVPKHVPVPPSLKNIYKEIESDTGQPSRCLPHGDLSLWAEQGVLLLNSVLTVESACPGSHANIGWEDYTDKITESISSNKKNIVFILWGNYAKKKGSKIDKSKHLILESSHPSPLGVYRGFSGCRHFSQTNDYLSLHNKTKINW